MIYGYARVSTIDQDLSIQHAELTAAGCTVVRSEKVTGTSTEGREELATLLQFLREGDTLVVTRRVDRLARSVRDLQNIVHDLRHRGVTLKATEQPVDTGTAAGSVSSTCWGCSLSSRLTSAKSARWKALSSAA
jgi:DNA invertase Pin-like site-specific DNA recombinase